jgi:TonB family protein
MSAQKVRPSERRLRVVLLWHDDVIAEQEYDEPQPVVLSDRPRAALPLPEGVVHKRDLTLLEPHEGGYRLLPSGALGGAVWLGGQRRDVGELGRSEQPVPLGPDDYGVVTVGAVSVFFQQVRAARAPRRTVFALDGELAAGIGLSAFVFAALLMLAFLDLREHPPEDPLELPSDVVAKYMVVPPPEETKTPTRSAGTEVKDPGLHGRKEAGGKRHKGAEGKVGEQNAEREDTHIQGEVRDQVAARVRKKGLLGALSGGGEGNAIAAAMDVPDVGDILGGMGAKPTQVGRGSAGAGLRGKGGGGGGEGSGNLFGAGGLDTGVGAGSGGGAGTGGGGPGVPGRKAKEVSISVDRGTPNTNGYLSAEQINRVVRAHQAAIRYCYEKEVQRQPNLSGRVSVSWRINLQGSVTSARVASSTMNNAGVEGCIVRQVRHWQFPKPDGGECAVTYPFVFGVQGG